MIQYFIAIVNRLSGYKIKYYDILRKKFERNREKSNYLLIKF